MSQASRPAAVVIGASAGAVEALSELLPALPADFPLPILVVVHLPPDGESVLPQLLEPRCRLPVVEVDPGQAIEPGTVYLAAPDYHLLVEEDHRLSVSSEEPVRFSRPSIDVLFETAADAYGPALIGLVLSGANSDGARGLRAVCDAGGRALVQRPDQAAVPTMPEAALAACPEATAVTLAEAARLLIAAGGGGEA